MKKFLFGAVALALLATASCKKDEDKGPSNNIKVGSETYNVSNFTSLANQVVVVGGSGTNTASITFSFGTGTGAPSTGTYKVVAASPTASEVQLTVGKYVNSVLTSYASTGDGTVNVTVGNSGGKTTITMPNAPVKQVMGGSETINVSANATQP